MRVALAAALAALVAAVPAAGADRATVYAASSLTEAFPRIDRSARFSFGGSNQLARQIREGAPADVFASASATHTQALYRDGLVERPATFAFNRLVVIVPRSNPARIGSVFDLRRKGVKIVIAAPGVPAGDYTLRALRNLGLTGILRNVLSREPDVKGVVGKVALGEADAGFAYATDAKATARRVRAIRLPPRAQPNIRYEIAVVKSSANAAAARAFVRRVLGPTGRGILSGEGFLLPPKR